MPGYKTAYDLPAAYLRQKLTQPLPIKGGVILRTIGEAANYILRASERAGRTVQSLAACGRASARPGRRDRDELAGLSGVVLRGSARYRGYGMMSITKEWARAGYS